MVSKVLCPNTTEEGDIRGRPGRDRPRAAAARPPPPLHGQRHPRPPPGQRHRADAPQDGGAQCGQSDARAARAAPPALSLSRNIILFPYTSGSSLGTRMQPWTYTTDR